MRAAGVQIFLDRSAEALRAAKVPSDRAAKACERAIDLWSGAEGTPGTSTAERLPVCDWVDPALEIASQGPRAARAMAFRTIVPGLVWRRRATAEPSDAQFWNGHANAMILGPGGLEERRDIWVGATVMAPGTTYADHDHPPEEVYLSLAPGEWWNAEMDWTDPGPTGAIYNPPGIRHRMRSGGGPFLALWYLPV